MYAMVIGYTYAQMETIVLAAVSSLLGIVTWPIVTIVK
jgi:hypothetical protein